MATQVSYPGIYIQEFTPGAPIQGVGTSTAAFIGTALSGPINTPTQLTSWDAFVNVFGGFIPQEANRYLAPAVYGFFTNGGTTCYIVRASTGAHALATLLTRVTAAPDLIATAIAEGTIGNSITAQVVDSSRLASMLAAAGSADTTLSAAHASTSISSFDATNTQITVGGNKGFAVGDRVLLEKGATQVTTTITATQSTNVIVVVAPVASHAALVGGTIRIADLQPGQLTLRVIVPSGLVLSQALPEGALISISEGTSENVTVASAGGDTITLATALAHTHPMSGPSFPQIASLEFDLIVTGATSEKWPQLSMNPLHPSYWATAVTSQIITLSLPATPPSGPLADPRPADAVYNLAGGTDDDRDTASDDIKTNPNTYLAPLVPLQDVNIVAIPGFTDANSQQALIGHCETLFNRFAVLDAVQDTAVGFPTLLSQYGQVRTPDGFAAIYFPWIQVINPQSGLTEYWPPCGHIIGVYAQTDQKRGVYKAPANVPIIGALGLQSLLSNADQGPLNLLGINILRVFPEQSQPLIWGARTTSTDSSWQYINVRRLFIYLEQSVEQGIRWAVFEPNNTSLWKKLTRTITQFLNAVQADGGIVSFYVRIDSALNPPSTQALGQLYIEVGIQPAYPAEFIVLRMGIWQGGSSVTES